ncbi:MAG TPA: FixH family protein [Polyangiaceae bacterium]|nr:FixH family protein [Polyangiaceae bacterium]
MMNNQKFLVLASASALAIALSACGGSRAASGSDSFPTEALFQLQSDSGQEQVIVRTAPEQPPTRGIVEMQLTITDATTGDPEPGLDLKVVPWMPAMGHGTSVTPTVVETAPGIYDLGNLGLFMPGTWQIRTQWSGAAAENVTPTLEVR